MSDPDVVVTRDFCERGGRAEGRIDPSRTERLNTLLLAASAIDWRVSGTVGRDGRMRILVEAQGDVVLICQRCLGSLTHRVDARRAVVFVPAGMLGSVEDEADDEDRVPVEPTLRLTDWVVDEVLLSLPYAPVHPSDQCGSIDDGEVDRVSAKQH